MTKEAFTEKFGPEPRKDDLTILCSKQDDPTDQVHSRRQGLHASSAHACKHGFNDQRSIRTAAIAAPCTPC